MRKKREQYSPSDDDFDVIFLDDNDDNDIEEWVDNEDDAEIDWISDEDDTQIGWIDDDSQSSADQPNKKKKNRKSAPGKSISKAGGKALKTSGKAVQSTAKGAAKVIQVFAHLITLGLIVFIMCQIGIHFWNNHSSFGNINTAISDRNYTLAGFLGVGAVLLLYELISFFWALSKRRIGKKSSAGKQDVGRGLFSFLLIGVLAYLAAYFNGYIPESHNVLIGLKEGAILYGSLFNILLPVCIAGVISCLIRKFTDR